MKPAGPSHVVATTQIVDPAGETVEFPGRRTDPALSPDETLLAVKTTGCSSLTPGLGDIVFIDMASTKGLGTHYTEANVPLKREMFGQDWHGFNTHDHMGSVSFIVRPTRKALEAYTYRAA